MRRFTGLFALLVLVFGSGWLLYQESERAREGGQSAVFEPMRSGDESVAPPDIADGTPASATPTPAPDAPAAGTAPAGPDVATAPDQPEMAPAAEPESPLVSGPETATAPEAPAPQTETATSEPPPASEPAPDDAPSAGTVPSFDIVRVEPSGDTVIAGLAAPETTVEVLDGTEPVATAEANERGEWALVLDAPLPPGTHDLAIRTTSSDKSTVTLSDQRVAVSVPEGAGEEPLVVLNAPDAASRVMQVPPEPEVATAPKAPETPEVATAPEAPKTPEVAAAPETPGTPEVATAPEAPTTPEVAAAPELAPTPTPEPSAPPAAATTETEIASAPPTEPAPPPVTTAPETPAAEPEAATAPAAPPPAEPEIAAVPPPDTATDEEQAPPVTEAPKPPEPKVSVAAVEAETDGALYIAGTATTPEPVRVYIDDELVGEAKPSESGTWLVETKREMEPGEYVVRADQIEAGSGAVIVRAEVPFEREIDVAVLKQTLESADPGGAEVAGSVAGPMSVIIKRGDNLWRISREMYGHGMRFSTIYQANKDQIRNPNRIYPGQIFVLPAGDTAWQSN